MKNSSLLPETTLDQGDTWIVDGTMVLWERHGIANYFLPTFLSQMIMKQNNE